MRDCSSRRRACRLARHRPKPWRVVGQQRNNDLGWTVNEIPSTLGPYQFDRTCAATICTLTASRGCSGEQVPDRKGGARRLPPAAERRRVGLRQRAERELPGVHQARSTSTVGQTCGEFHWNRSPAARPRHTFRLQLPTTIRGVACSSMVAACSLHREAVNTRVLSHVAQSTEDNR